MRDLSEQKKQQYYLTKQERQDQPSPKAVIVKGKLITKNKP